MTHLQQAHKTLKTVFGFESFRPLQQEIILNILDKRDTLGIMPTGGGKSLCFQLPALLFKGTTVVVSPLISLMKDQIGQLTALGIPAVVLNSSLHPEDYVHNMELIRRREAQLVYLAPETLLKERTLSLLEDIVVDNITIDEAHCISEWGHDFRPEYRQLAALRRRFPNAVCSAFTATATPQVQRDIQKSLGFDDAHTFVGSFNRHNLYLEVEAKENGEKQVIKYVRDRRHKAGIIYCATRKGVDELAQRLKNEGFDALPYHAGMAEEDRKFNQEKFITDNVQVMVATVAFGMGIDKPNVRFVVHYDLPKNIETYYQEIGRAGRDGLPSDCLLLFSYADIQKVKFFISQMDESRQRIATIHLNTMVGFAETFYCRRKPLLQYFGEQYDEENCGACDNCLGDEVVKTDITADVHKMLKTIRRTNEIFGMNHIIDILKGSKKQKVMTAGHDRLDTYGEGDNLSRTQWFFIGRQLLQMRFLDQDTEFGSLKITPMAVDHFKKQLPVLGVVPEDKPKASKKVRKQTRDLPDFNEELFEILRKKRKEMADAADVPPYHIFPDRTLIDMSVHFPQSLESMRTIHGIGAVKLEKYAPQFLEVVKDFCSSQNIAENPREEVAAVEISDEAPAEPKTKKYVQMGLAIDSGLSLRRTAEIFGVKLQTVMDNLYKFLLEGRNLERDIQELNEELLTLSAVELEDLTEAMMAFSQTGVERLKPVFQTLNRNIPYDSLHYLRLYYLINHG
jgi:ATP-dependent DNA helicase RecQ